MNKSRIGIVGAGIGGLAAALALLRRGFDVQVYEQASELGEIGAGVQITPNGSKVLMELGLTDEIMAIGTRTQGKDNYLWNTGQKSTFMQLGDRANEQYGSPYLTFHRADLHAMLLKAVLALKPDAVLLDKRCDGIAQTAAGVQIRFSDGSSAEEPVLVGADGIHSRVRQALFGPDSPEFTGCIAWRGLIPAAPIEGAVNLRGGSMWLGPTAHIVTYPVRQGALLNFIAMVDRDDWLSESWTEAGTVEECLGDLAGWHPTVQLMVRNIAIPYKWALRVREPLDAWSVGRITLLGDACHSTLPFLSQGANMAIEDSLVLARCLCQDDEPELALRRYEAARRPRTARITRTSAEQLRRVHNPELADPASAQRYIEREWASQRVDDRYGWVYGYDAGTVAITQGLELPPAVAPASRPA
ncbi:monooxygenase [Verticiella sediminum]|uniref:Monooxygenase n=1 Tax=Verticiella sediminum TaxID=1247510 RepID=A0A556ALU3_9BURK|nr:FAD-dependent monooxygenase [Verticiella sediminum]TSH93858.1 monooxygenase [Verticiella sediminum]